MNEIPVGGFLQLQLKHMLKMGSNFYTNKTFEFPPFRTVYSLNFQLDVESNVQFRCRKFHHLE